MTESEYEIVDAPTGYEHQRWKGIASELRNLPAGKAIKIPIRGTPRVFQTSASQCLSRHLDGKKVRTQTDGKFLLIWIAPEKI